ncbi:hypothetical protein Tco_0332760 [Tanacetum coccineum]
MSVITDVKCVLTQKALDAFCNKFHIPEEVHPILPNQNDTMHERPAGKIGLYTRFFDFANFRLPLSTFLVDVLRHFRMIISQLSVIGAAKVSHFEILCRVYGIIPTVGLFRCFYVNSKKSGWMSFSKRSDNASVCYTKPLDSLKNWNDHFFWVDDFAFPASFLWHTVKHVTRDPAPVAADFNAQDYATLVAHSSPFQKFPEAFLCCIEMGDFYSYGFFIHTPDRTKVRNFEREQNEGEARLLDTTIGRTVPLLLVAPDRAESELKASVKKLFDGGKAGYTAVEDVAPVQLTRQGNRKSVIMDAGGASHPPKKLREDHGTPSGTSIGDKSMSAIKRLLAGAVLNAELESGDHTDSVAELNLRTIGAPRRFMISSDSSHHSGTNVAEAKVDSLVRSFVPIITTVTTINSTVDPASVAKEKLVEPSSFYIGSSSARITDPTTGVFSDLTGSDFLIGAIRTVINPNTDLQKVYAPQWSMTNGSRLDNGRVYREMVDEFAPPKFFVSVRRMEHDQLFTEFNVGAARQISLSVEVRMHVEYIVKEKRRLKSVVDRQAELLKVREGEIENLKAQLLLREAEAVEAIRLRAKASNFEVVTKLEALAMSKECELTDLNALVTSIKSQNGNLADRVHELEISSFGLQEKVTVYENCMDQLEKFQDDRMKVVNDKFDKLYTHFMEMTLYLEEKFYPHLLTTISGHRWLLTHGMKLAIVNCLNSPKYLSALGAAIGKAIEKGMQDGLSAGITHGKEGRVLTDVAAHNPSAKVDYISALQQLQNVNFSLLAKLKSNKDASVETVMDILRLEGPLAEKLGLNELQPNVDQLMKIRENIANQRSALRDVFVPLAGPFSASVLTGTEGTSDIVSVTANTITALSTTFASNSSVAPISVDDYEVIGADDQAVADGNAASFPNVDDAELNIP